MSEKQIAALNLASKKKQQKALEKTELAIEYLIENNFKITVSSVAKQADVSVSFVYKHPQIVSKIKSLKEKYKQRQYSDKSLSNSNSNIVERLKTENAKLNKEIEELKAYINTIEDSKKSIIELQKENQELKQELEFTQISLQEIRSFILDNGYDSKDEIEENQRYKVIQQVSSDNNIKIN